MKSSRFVIMMLIVIWGVQLFAQISLNDLKAAYIEKFTRFIDWPETESADKDNFVIGYYQLDDFMEIFQVFLVDIPIKQKNVKFLHISSKSDLSECDLIYLPELSKDKRAKIIEKLNGYPVLTISHSKGYAEYGIHINFYLEKGKLKFEMNPEAMKKNNLKASFHLLKLAKIVTDKGGV